MAPGEPDVNTGRVDPSACSASHGAAIDDRLGEDACVSKKRWDWQGIRCLL